MRASGLSWRCFVCPLGAPRLLCPCVSPHDLEAVLLERPHLFGRVLPGHLPGLGGLVYLKQPVVFIAIQAVPTGGFEMADELDARIFFPRFLDLAPPLPRLRFLFGGRLSPRTSSAVAHQDTDRFGHRTTSFISRSRFVEYAERQPTPTWIALPMDKPCLLSAYPLSRLHCARSGCPMCGRNVSV